MTRPSRGRAVTLVASMLGAALLTTFFIDAFYAMPGATTTLLAFGVAFAASERLAFDIEARSETVRYSPSDLAFGLGLVYVGPLGFIVARLLGSLVGQILFHQTSWFKRSFNLANIAVETAVGYALFRLAVGAEPEPGLATWAALMSSLFLALLIGGVFIAAVIAGFEGGLATQVRITVASSTIFHLPGAALASTLAVAMMVTPFLGVAVASLVPALWLTIRAHGKLLHRYSALIGAHQFSREVGDATELNDILTTATEQIGANLHCQFVAIRVWDNHGVRTEAFHGGRALARELPSNIAQLIDAGFIAEVPDDTSDDHIELDRLQVLLADEQGELGCIVVANRLGVNARFEIAELRRLTAMAQQLTVAVRKGQLHAQLHYEATHDRLTGLANRRFFETWVDDLLSGESSHGSLLFIDLDRFKEVNDAFGHQAGDSLLEAVANRIRMASPIDGLAARFGGDEFAVYAPSIDDGRATELADRIATALEAPFEIDQVSLTIAPSIGVVHAPAHGHTTEALLRRADIAMYEAKRFHVHSAVFQPELEADNSARLKLLADLRQAIVDDELDVHFQPQVDMRTGQVIGAEALARWTHPEHGAVSPALFVELAEGAGLIEALTNRVLARALQAAAQWQRRGWAMNIAVNISARSLLDTRLVTMVERCLEETQLDASSLTLEITESTMMTDPTRTHNMLHALTSLGVTISVDDFGTGYSSLRSLGHLPVSELKIDRSFVMAMETSAHDAIIVRSTIDLAHNLGLKAVAEGVEDNWSMHQLVELNCDLAQGYGISRPLPLERFNHWFVSRHASSQEMLVDPLNWSPDAIDVFAEPDLESRH